MGKSPFQNQILQILCVQFQTYFSRQRSMSVPREDFGEPLEGVSQETCQKILSHAKNILRGPFAKNLKPFIAINLKPSGFGKNGLEVYHDFSSEKLLGPQYLPVLKTVPASLEIKWQ